MHSIYHMSRVAFSLLALAILCLTSRSYGIEMRSSTHNRAVVRNVSLSQAEEVEAPVIERVETPEEISDQPNALDEVTVIDEGFVDEPVYAGPGYHAMGTPYESHLWVDFDFLTWWRKERKFPVLATTDSDLASPTGVVGSPTTLTLFGGTFNEHPQAGGRIELGVWLDPMEILGVGGHFVSIGDATINLLIDQDDYAFIARPFFDSNPGAPGQSSLPIVHPTAVVFPRANGWLSISSTSEVSAGDVFARRVLLRGNGTQLDFLVGYQFSNIEEDLIITTQSDIDNNPADPPATLDLINQQDSFDCRNEFHGAHFGFQGDYDFGMWGLELLAKFAFGNMRQQAILSGFTDNVQLNGASAAGYPVASGLLVQEASADPNNAFNAGTYSQDEFSYMHDVGVSAYCYPMANLKLSVGYGLMYWSSVARPGNQVDFAVDSRLFPAGANPNPVATHPVFPFKTSAYVAHGLTLGAEFTF